MAHTRFEIGGEFVRSWRAMLAVILGMWVSAIPSYSIGAFIGPVSAEFGASLTQVTGWSLAWSFGCVLSAPVVGAIADRVGARRVILTALASLTAALLAVSSLTKDLTGFYVGALALGAIGAGTSAITYGRVVNSRFDLGLGTALGLMSVGLGLGAVFGPRLMQAIIDSFGWRQAFAALALLPLAVLPLLVAWLREGSSATGRELVSSDGATRGEAMRRSVFWVLAAGTILYGVCVGGVSVNLIPFLTSDGLSRADAASAAGLFGAATVVGRLFGGMIIDRARVHVAILLAIVLVAEAAAFVMLGLGGGTYLIPALLVFGVSVGAEADGLAYCTIKIFGRRCFGSIYAVLGIVMLYIGTGIGPVLFNATRDWLGSYQLAFYVWAGLALMAAPLFASVVRVPFFDQPNAPLAAAGAG